MICDGIIQNLKVKFDTYVQYQDGHEMVGTLAEAKREWAESHKSCSKTTRNPEEAPVYQEQQMVVSRIGRAG